MTAAHWAGVAALLERRQVPIFLGALAFGVLMGWTAPDIVPTLEHAISPVLGALLYVTFLQVPLRELTRSFRAGKFLAATLVANFIAVPLVLASTFWLLPDDHAVRLGVLLVLLTPCVDYVIVFSAMAGGSGQRLLAATPLLLIAQMLLLPLYLTLFLDGHSTALIEPGPFVEAFLFLIALPLTLAWATQIWATRKPAGYAFSLKTSSATVPLMAATLITVVASQVPALAGHLAKIAAVLPFYGAFLVVMAFVGLAVTRLFRLDVPDSGAVIFAGAARNSLVVLPFALALPESFSVAVAVIVAQTLVEVIGMVIYIRAVPRLTGPRLIVKSKP
ncbi:ACR3 family arsenite efflux pump ArsB [Saccharothrix saharensis]|uniref:ACR3 family arsenite efflux pump ArsB n=1 Tax=Saccharothrix saharensis TaxID=571190 RepID=A0A543JNS4_9PSEU|nr:arsenic resistance protein [Saccharothrix saharensis]TQM84483.1 ACR3 family arsenite efflux pump ArsB [Saccharothrix saharensis]